VDAVYLVLPIIFTATMPFAREGGSTCPLRKTHGRDEDDCEVMIEAAEANQIKAYDRYRLHF